MSQEVTGTDFATMKADIISSAPLHKIDLERKVELLQKSLSDFRVEMDMKMGIMEQILTTRNEQFTVHKKLLEKEQELFESFISHWRNPAFCSVPLTHCDGNVVAETEAVANKNRPGEEVNGISNDAGNIDSESENPVISVIDSSIPSDPSGLRTPSQTSSIEDKEIPFLFYNELLQNSDLQDLLAGKITQCLDSTTGDGDEVVKTVSSMAETEVVDAFFKDFFEIELGLGADGAAVPMEFEVVQETSDSFAEAMEDGEIVDENEPPPEAIYANTSDPTVSCSLTPSKVTRPDVIVRSPLCRNVVQLPPTSATSVSTATNSQDYVSVPSSIATNVTTNQRTIITVVKDDFRAEKAKSPTKPMNQDKFTSPAGGQPSFQKSTKTKRKVGGPGYKKPRFVESKPASPSKTSDLDPWSRLGRRSINPKIPEEKQESKPVVNPSAEPVVMSVDASLPSLPKEIEVLIRPIHAEKVTTASPSPPKPIVSDASPAIMPIPSSLSPAKEDLTVKSPQSSSLPLVEQKAEQEFIQNTHSTGKKSGLLARSLKRAAERSVEPCPPQSTPSDSLGKNRAQSHNILQRKSFSTPRKRNTHVRNLQFKTPPGFRVGSPSQSYEYFKKENKRPRLDSPLEQATRKKLKWGSTSPFRTLDKIPEQDEELQRQMNTPPPRAQSTAPDGTVPTNAWIPPPTPRAISSEEHVVGWDSPCNSGHASPVDPYRLSLPSIFGSPLCTGKLPRTPGRTTPNSLGKGGPFIHPFDSPLDLSKFLPALPALQAPTTPLHHNTPIQEGEVEETSFVVLTSESQSLYRISPEKQTSGQEIKSSTKAEPQSGQPRLPFQPVSNEELPEEKTCESDIRIGNARGRRFDKSRIQKKNETRSKLKKTPETEVSDDADWQPGDENMKPPMDRVLRSRSNFKPKIVPLSLQVPLSTSATAVLASSAQTPTNVLALQKRSLPFPEVGFELRSVMGRKPAVGYKIGGRQKVLSVSRQITSISILHDKSCVQTEACVTVSKGEPESILGRLLTQDLVVPGKPEVQMMTYNQNGELISLPRPKFIFQDHFNRLLESRLDAQKKDNFQLKFT